jgi:cytochrome c oxidase subunit 4
MTDKGAHDHNKLYLIVWFILLALTIIEVYLAYMTLPVTVMLVTLLFLSFLKAGLIVAYFMHLRFEKPSLFWTLIPATLICIALLSGFFPDSMRILSLGQ